jgi:hypothetical protein
VIQRKQSLAELNKEAWQILVKELGVVKAMRFWRQFDMGSGNFATDRDEWQKDLTVDEIVDRIERRRKNTPGKKPTVAPARRKKRSSS